MIGKLRKRGKVKGETGKRRKGKMENKPTEQLHVVCGVDNLIYKTHPHQFDYECTPGMTSAMPSILMPLPPLNVFRLN